MPESCTGLPRNPETNSTGADLWPGNTLLTPTFELRPRPLTGVKYRRAQELVDELWAKGTGVLSTQVLQELCVNLRRKAKLPYSMDEMRSLIRDYKSWQVVVSNHESLVARPRNEDSESDIFLGCAYSPGGSGLRVRMLLYSEDLRPGNAMAQFEVVNPLLTR